MELRVVVFPDENIFLAELQKFGDVFGGDDVTFAKLCVLDHAANDLRYVVAQNFSDRVLNFYFSQKISSSLLGRVASIKLFNDF